MMMVRNTKVFTSLLTVAILPSRMIIASVTVNSYVTLNTEDDSIGVLHVGFADAEDGFLGI